MCKKEFTETAHLIFNNRYLFSLIHHCREFLNTINVDNENFYSDHLIFIKDRLISTTSFKNFSPLKLLNGNMRRSSFDLD